MREALAPAGQPPVEVEQAPDINHELRVSTDTATWLAETLHGSMRTTFEFSHDGQDFRGEDGVLLDPVFDKAITEAKSMTEWNPSMLFELRRRMVEREELNSMHNMATGKLPNTMIVISDFPPELMGANEDIGGYNVERQQTMMRVISRSEDGTFSITTQSLDGSNRQALEAIYAAMGETPEEGELLSQRIHCDLPEAWQENLTGNLTKVYDESLADQRGGEWHAGISQDPDRNITNTYDFVREQQDLIEWFTSEKLVDAADAEKHRYKLAATAKARFERHLQRQNAPDLDPKDVAYASVTRARIAAVKTLERELMYEERRASERGDTYSGCGGTVSSGGSGSSSAESQYRGSGYGSKSMESGDCEFTSKECPMCHEKNVKTRVRKDPISEITHITGSCGCSKSSA